MSNKDLLDNIKKLREMTGVGFKDCKVALDETKGDIVKLNETKMANNILVKDNLVNLIAKIGEKITIRRTNFFDNSSGSNYSYVHSAIEKNIGKIISAVKIEGISVGKNDGIGTKISKFLNDNSLLHQVWIMDSKKKVLDILKENSLEQQIEVLNFVRYKVGEGV